MTDNFRVNYFLFREVKNEQVVGHYKVYFPQVGEKGFYWQIQSLEAFKNYWGTFHYKKATEGLQCDHYFFSKSAGDIATDIASDLDKLIPFFFHNLPILEFPDVWSFYEAIGWDYKKKSFFKEN